MWQCCFFFSIFSRLPIFPYSGLLNGDNYHSYNPTICPFSPPFFWGGGILWWSHLCLGGISGPPKSARMDFHHHIFQGSQSLPWEYSPKHLATVMQRCKKMAEKKLPTLAGCFFRTFQCFSGNNVDDLEKSHHFHLTAISSEGCCLSGNLFNAIYTEDSSA